MVEEYLEEELVVALLENDDDEREEEIIFAGERTRITTDILYGVSFQRRSKKNQREREKRRTREFT